jgi:hypothetical protein
MRTHPFFPCFALLLAIIIISGCTGLGATTTAAPTPPPQVVYVTVLVTPTPTNALVKDPIIGVWRFTAKTASSDYDYRVQFDANGTSIETLASDSTIYVPGIWNFAGDNTYIVTSVKTGDKKLYTYNPQTNTIFENEYSAFIYFPYQGSVWFNSSSGSSSTQSGSSSSTHLSGYGDDVVSFTASGSGLRIFDMKYTGQHNFAVKLKDGSGDYLALLANEIGSYSGKTSETLTTGKYFLDVTASGPWIIDISSI